MHDLIEISLKGSRDVFMHEESPSVGFDNNVLPNPLDLPSCSLPSQSPGYYLDELINNFLICDANNDLACEVNLFNMLGGNANKFVSLGCLSGFNAFLCPYYMYLEDLPRKIT